VEAFQVVVEDDRGAMEWAAAELAYMVNADLIRERLG
jgi:hypothetical protein